MSSFPGSPRTLKGAIVGVDILNPLARVIIFQYNPVTLSRTISARTLSSGTPEKAKLEAFKVAGPPEENISLDVEIDATDQLEKGEVTATSMGIYPQLSALEMLLYPKSSTVIANFALYLLGTMQMVPTELPMTLFIWGMKRVVPVQIKSFTINEQAFDANLNPIRAKVSLSMKVITYMDMESTHIGAFMYIAHQVTKEVMAVIGGINNLAAVAGGDVKLI